MLVRVTMQQRAQMRTRTRTQGWVADATVLLVIMGFRCIKMAAAYPLPLLEEAQMLAHRRSTYQQQYTKRDADSETAGKNISPKVWVPVVVGVLALLAVFCFIWTRSSVLAQLRGGVRGTVRTTPASGSTTSPLREVTGSRLTLANTISTDRTSTGPADGGGTGRRTGRRNQRTSSLISARSLPVYMKEPGDQELVIFRGPDAIEMDMIVMGLDETMMEEGDTISSDDEDREDGREERECQVGQEESDEDADRRASARLIDETGHEEQRRDPDTSTTGLLSHQHQHQHSDPHASDMAENCSAFSQRGAYKSTSDIPSDSETPPDYEASIPLPVSPSEEDQERTGWGSISMDSATSSRRNENHLPPGLSGSESHPPPISPSDTQNLFHSSTPMQIAATPISRESPGRVVTEGSTRRSRLASQISRVSQFLHLHSLRVSPSANANRSESIFGNTLVNVYVGASPSASRDISSSAGSDSGLEGGSGTAEPEAAQSRVSDVHTRVAATGANGIGDSRRPETSNVIQPNDSDVSPFPPPPSSFPSSLPVSTGTRSAAHQNRHQHSISSASTLTLPLSRPLRTLPRHRSSNSLARQRSSTTLCTSASISNFSKPNLTSASTLSLAQSVAVGATSISAPLSHTVTRTEILYPAGGPTPDQVKLLSSRERLGMFGVPYGESAVEFARSCPRLDVNVSDPPPQVFENQTNEGGSSAAAVTSSRIRNARGSLEDEENNRDGNDPDALPASSTLRRNRNGNNLHASRRERNADDVVMDARLLLPMFL